MTGLNNYLTEEYLLSVADVVIVDEETGVQLATSSLKSHNISQSVDSTEIKAGQENDTLVTIKSNKTVTVELEDVRQSRQWLAMQMGSEIKSESIEIYAFPKRYTVEAQNKVTLAHTPIAGQTIKVYKADTKQVVSAELSGSSLTLTGAQQGDVVIVEAYKYTADSAEVLRFKSDGFAKSYRLILDEPVFNDEVEVIGRRQTIFFKATADDNFTLNGSSDRSEKTNTYKFTVKKHPLHDDLGVIVYHEEGK